MEKKEILKAGKKKWMVDMDLEKNLEMLKPEAEAARALLN